MKTETAFTNVIKDLQEMDASKVKGFIVLVDGGIPNEDGKSGKGLNAICGEVPIILNLLANMDQEPLTLYTAMRLMRHDSE